MSCLDVLKGLGEITQVLTLACDLRLQTVLVLQEGRGYRDLDSKGPGDCVKHVTACRTSLPDWCGKLCNQ